MSRAPDASTAGALDGEHALFDLQNDPEEELDVFLTPRDEIMNRYNDFPDYAPVIAERADGMRKAAAGIDDDIGVEIADSVLAAVKGRLSKAPTGSTAPADTPTRPAP